MTWILIVLFVFVVGLANARRLRKFIWIAQIALGDGIAMRKGTYMQRWVRKQAHKRAGKTINKLRGK